MANCTVVVFGCNQHNWRHPRPRFCSTAAQLLGLADRSDGLEWRAVEAVTGALRYP